MRFQLHVRLLAFGLLSWLAFWIAGMPDYYQQYSTVAMLVVSAVVTIAIVVVAHLILRRTRPERRLTLAIWISFYFTVPLAVADYLYCGVHLGHGARFFVEFWYLTAFYVIPWVVFLPMAALLRDATRRLV